MSVSNLGRHPDDKTQLRIPVFPCDLPAAKRGQINTNQHGGANIAGRGIRRV